MSNNIEIAKQAILEIAAADEIGELTGEKTLDDFKVLSFASTNPGYIGWHWSVSMHKDFHTVNEVWLEPGESALVAKPWVPWSERVQPGDLSPGDLIETAKDDPRLIAGYAGVEEIDLAEPFTPAGWSIGLGRERVLSPLGIDDAVDRWREGENGPRAAIARYADLPCSSCGWWNARSSIWSLCKCTFAVRRSHCFYGSWMWRTFTNSCRNSKRNSCRTCD